MYPWVNRITKSPYAHPEPPFHDGNGVPLHGFYAIAPRKIEISKPKENTIVVTVRPTEVVSEAPSFTEEYTITTGKL